jgi:hypothetical protein
MTPDTSKRLDELEAEFKSFTDTFEVAGERTLSGELLSIARELVAENEQLRSRLFTAHDDISGSEHVCGCSDCVAYRGDR